MRCAELCIRVGGHGITIHPRPDQRHIRPRDVDEIAEMLRTHTGVELNIEGNPFHGLLDDVERVRPTQCTVRHEQATQKTSDHGFDLAKDATRLTPVIARLRAIGCRSSVFVDADEDAVSRAHDSVPIGSSSTPSRTRARSRGEDAVAPFVRAAEKARAIWGSVSTRGTISIR